MKALRRAALFMTAVAVLAGIAHGSKVKEIDRELQGHDIELKEIRKRIEEGRRKLDHLKREERDVMKKLDVIDDDLDLTLRYLRTLGDKEKGLSEQIILLEGRLAELQDDLAMRTEQMKRRLRNIYKQGQPGFLDAFLGTRSLTQSFERMRFFQSLNAYDRNSVAELNRTRQAVSEQKSTLETKLLDIQQVQSEREKQKENLIVQRKQKTVLLNAIETKKANYEQMVKELKESQKAITGLISALQLRKKKEQESTAKKPGEKRERAQPSPFKGRIQWPTTGTVVRRLGKFQHPRYKTTTMNLGIDIKAEAGQPVVAVSAGTAVYVGRMRGYGNLLIVEHEGSLYSLYAHLNEIVVKPDQKVEAGELVGHVGDTGSFEGAKLHFELRQDKEILDPEKYLP